MGTPVGPAVKLIRALRRAPGTAIEDFRAAVAASAQLAPTIPGVWRFVRSLTTPSGYAHRDPVYDLVDELWFDDEPAARAALASPELAQLLDAIGADPASLATFLAHDHLMKDGEVPAGALKNYEFVTRRPDLTVEQFRSYWLEHHGPLACGIATMLRYVQSHAIDSEYADGAEPAWEGTAITWFADYEAMRDSGADPVYKATRADEENFLGAPLRLPFLITTEQELVAPVSR
ncbi:unannotated protein [freshwater metagenome]|uniref:Unannotated protein n=1 Tax=freshwater metagenome TaxID=449393 RepID=A0A6J7HA38_9ZZZZ|nr:EthD family reductase [Actinomycetota bacterium]